MRKVFLFSILVLFILFSGACKSKPAPAPSESADSRTSTTQTTSSVISTTQTSNPNTAAPGATSTTTTTPETTSANTYGSVTFGTSGNLSGRHQSGIILDGATTYKVEKGDILASIAKKAYQDGSLYPLIMMVSPVVTDPDKIEPQMELIIPNPRTNMNDPTAKQSINRFFLQIANIEDQRGRKETADLIRAHTR